MPIYEYTCPDCKSYFDELQSINDESSPPCPTCKGTNAKRKLSTPGGFNLKGSGWYRDGYASAGSKPKG